MPFDSDSDTYDVIIVDVYDDTEVVVEVTDRTFRTGRSSDLVEGVAIRAIVGNVELRSYPSRVRGRRVEVLTSAGAQ